MRLEDRFGRVITGLRLSVTQKCNLNCIYCHHEGELKTSMRKKREMSPSEIGRILKAGNELGLNKLKITGGEPLMRRDIAQIVEYGAEHMDEISLTTNGTMLKNKADKLKDAGLDRVNISLDTLRPQLYKQLTGKPYLDKVIEGIEEAVEAELEPVKINMVLMKGMNEFEVERMMEFCSRNKLILQIIELEETRGGEKKKFFQRYHSDIGLIEKQFEARATEVKLGLHNRRKYTMPGGNVVEFVRPMHNSDFCMHCKRIRISSNGELKPCLLRNDNHVDIMGAVRNGRDEELKFLFKKAVELREPYWR